MRLAWSGCSHTAGFITPLQIEASGLHLELSPSLNGDFNRLSTLRIIISDLKGSGEAIHAFCLNSLVYLEITTFRPVKEANRRYLLGTYSVDSADFSIISLREGNYSHWD